MRTDGQGEYCTAFNNEPELNMLDFSDNTIRFTEVSMFVKPEVRDSDFS
jgi:hypothetical protein